MDEQKVIEGIKKLKELLGPDGEYGIGRKDGEPLGLGDQLVIGQVLEDLETGIGDQGSA